jgi:hypothetical protein
LNSIVYRGIGEFLRESYYKSVPYQIRHLFDADSRDLVFRRALSEFKINPAAWAYPDNPLPSQLIYGWGNEAWSAREEYLAACIEHALKSHGAILECGSGLSTIVLAAIAKEQGRILWVLEHNEWWADKISYSLEKFQFNASISVKPLKDSGDFCWYDAPLKLMPAGFSLIICDGPPNKSTKGGRYGLVRIMQERLSPGCVILLDDANRQEEFNIAKRWAEELGASFTVQGNVKPYLIMTLP